jgi:hypothetical protein
MNAEETRSALHKRPFRPFSLRTSDGREYPVRPPEFAAFVPGRRALFVGYDEDRWDVLDLIHVTSVHYGDGEPPKARRKRRR